MNMEDVIVYYKDKIAPSALGEYLKPFYENKVAVVCIGTDKCIGDSLGPLVGTLLVKNKFSFPVFGTLDEPIHALNISERISFINKYYPLHRIIAIDACLGEKNHVGNIQIRSKPIYPGKGVGKNLPSVGDLSIIGIVDGIKTYKSLSLHSVRLSFVMSMAEVIVKGLLNANI